MNATAAVATKAPQTVNVNERLAKARAARRSGAQPSAKSIDGLLKAASLDRPQADIAKIARRLEDVPETMRRTYLRAVGGKSKPAACGYPGVLCRVRGVGPRRGPAVYGSGVPAVPVPALHGQGAAMKRPVEPLAYSIPQAAVALSASERQVYVLAARHGLPTVKIGGRRLVRVADLKEWLAAQPAAAARLQGGCP